MSRFFAAADIPMPREVFIPQMELQQMFNRGEYMARAEREKLEPCLKSVTARKVGGNLDGMRGYTTGYDDPTTRVRIFLVQYFMTDDGEIGASGLEDPKLIYADGIFYKPIVPVEDDLILDEL